MHGFGSEQITGELLAKANDGLVVVQTGDGGAPWGCGKGGVDSVLACRRLLLVGGQLVAGAVGEELVELGDEFFEALHGGHGVPLW